MVRPRYLNDALAIVVVVVAYFLAAELGLRFAVANGTATAIWPCTGIALAALLLYDYRRIWPGILLGSWLAALTTPDSVGTALGVAVGSTLEALLGYYLIRRFASGKQVFERAQDIFKFSPACSARPSAPPSASPPRI